MHSEQNQEPVADAAAAEAASPAAETAAPAERVESSGLSPAECGARLAELFPALFVAPGAPGPYKPIKLRVHADILERAPGVFSKRVLGIFFSRYTTSNGYLKALVADGAQRHDLDGQPAGTIADEHRAAALEEIARRQAIAAERRAAQRKAMAPAPVAGAAGGAEHNRRERPPREHAPRPESRPPRQERRERPQRPAPRNEQRFERRPERRPDAPQTARREPPRDAPPVTATPADPAQRERWLLLRAFESSPLSKANFCALKRISEAELDALLTQARAEQRTPAG